MIRQNQRPWTKRLKAISCTTCGRRYCVTDINRDVLWLSACRLAADYGVGSVNRWRRVKWKVKVRETEINRKWPRSLNRSNRLWLSTISTPPRWCSQLKLLTLEVIWSAVFAIIRNALIRICLHKGFIEKPKSLPHKQSHYVTLWPFQSSIHVLLDL